MAVAARILRRVPVNIVLIFITTSTLLITAKQIDSEASIRTMWAMVVLALLAGTQAHIVGSTSPTPIIICPTICFSFAILLCWGLGPAILAQCMSCVVANVRIRRRIGEVLATQAEYTLSFVAAAGLLWYDWPDPIHHQLPKDIADDVMSIIGAVAVWLAVFALCEIGLAKLRGVRLARLFASRSLLNHVQANAALLMLSPLLAIAADTNIGLVPLIFIPLYAVGRMLQLAVQRDRAARIDPLTSLANRAGLKIAFQELIGSEPAAGEKVALLLADLDEFKHVNDALGHEVGDQLIIAVAKRLSTVPLRGEVARLGGDEFGFVAITGGDDDARHLAGSVAQALADPICLDDVRVNVTASIGIAFRDDHDDFATLMRHADIAMYQAKRSGGGAAVYAPDEHQDSVDRLALLADFRRALEDRTSDAIRMHYQPQARLSDGRIEGVEALLRWRHPERGDISTHDLIALAERSSVIHALTNRVIDEVTAQIAAWEAEGIVLRTSINVSSRDLYGTDILSRLADRLAEYRIPRGTLQIEITESALLRDPSRVSGTVARICALGVTVSLDDFGTGYSSLQHLRKLPISEVKIDRSFVAAMAVSRDDAAIVRSTIDMARALGIRTVAEGVETAQTRDLLADAGCTLAQGWLTARPMPAAQMRAWLDEYVLATAAPDAGADHPGRPVPVGDPR